MAERPQNKHLTPGSPGRQKGIPNKKTLMAQEFAQKFLNDRDYVRSVKKRLTSGEPQWQYLEELVWNYAFGKPKESTHITTDGTLPPMQIAWLDYRQFFMESGEEPLTLEPPHDD